MASTSLDLNPIERLEIWGNGRFTSWIHSPEYMPQKLRQFWRQREVHPANKVSGEYNLLYTFPLKPHWFAWQVIILLLMTQPHLCLPAAPWILLITACHYTVSQTIQEALCEINLSEIQYKKLMSQFKWAMTNLPRITAAFLQHAASLCCCFKSGGWDVL